MVNTIILSSYRIQHHFSTPHSTSFLWSTSKSYTSQLMHFLPTECTCKANKNMLDSQSKWRDILHSEISWQMKKG